MIIIAVQSCELLVGKAGGIPMSLRRSCISCKLGVSQNVLHLGGLGYSGVVGRARALVFWDFEALDPELQIENRLA